MKRHLALLLILLLTSGANAAGRTACSVANIQIKQSDWRRAAAGEYSKIIGEFTNSCSEAIGVQLQFTFRDADGKVVDVHELWPASTRNIEPDSTYPFAFTVRVIAPATTMTTKVIEVHRW